MSDATLLLRVQASKKSGWLAAILNLVLPGAGYMYCGRWILGLIVLAFAIAIAVATGGLGSIPFMIILFVDGFLAAGRYNKKLINSILAEDQIRSRAVPPAMPQA